MWECRAVPGLVDELLDLLRALVSEDMALADGFDGGEIYLSTEPPPRVVVITHWRDEAALEAYVGPGWREQAVLSDAQGEYLAGDPHVWHFVRVGRGSGAS
jgi:heme-degrading monooxygenase HmoA